MTSPQPPELPHPRTGQLFASPVPAGAGWPGDPATPATPIATTANRVARLAGRAETIAELDAEISVCRGCPRLVSWREQVAVDKRRAFLGQPYWGRPVPGWGDEHPGIFILGLAPAAHGANRTGRIFTGDRSGDQLFAALHRAGLVSAPDSVDAADGLRAVGVRIGSPVRCAPPANAPTPQERRTCDPWLAAEWRLIADDVRVVVALGGFAWQVALHLLEGRFDGPKPKFGHGVVAEGDGVTLLGCYHPSQQNMFTGRLTPAMLDDVFGAAVRLSREHPAG
ncbi:uracil-DNA glycosylase [Mycolicibacterium fallax]|uniref:Type-5 uracil-DNA glycosylase n=1 Tax=Mycolicibacterium fallax TaxID=1793 RepID=A0A1X1R7R5_MYCFA|nr:uracil-DNA glycosylase [Mycolicibacterium fallax]ORV00920.1 hypothetical protein AWC04_14680 [Mycolicibacterium fallax]BBZ00466.1 hypothetical protein MFAL_39320 [Mycolicibacterium fallax]HOW93547.1 uracil-DNA glycosylase [Mycolicibacterium fallax]